MNRAMPAWGRPASAADHGKQSRYIRSGVAALLLAVSTSASVSASAQSRPAPVYCNGQVRPVGQNGTGNADDRIDDLMNHILEHVGVRVNFQLLPARVPNALAYMDAKGTRLVLYEPCFFLGLNDTAAPRWAKFSVLLHEIGHHLLGHVFEAGPDFKHRELEADEFSGFMLYRMGATLEEAEQVAEEFTQVQDTPTHPPKAQRLAAIASGWNRARAITVHEREMAELRDRRSKGR